MKIPHFKKIATAFSLAVIAGVVTFGVTGASSEAPIPSHNPSDGGGVSPTFTGLNVTGDITVDNTLNALQVFTSFISNNYNYPVNFSGPGGISIAGGLVAKDALKLTADKIQNDVDLSGGDLTIGSYTGLILTSIGQAQITTHNGAGIWLGGADGTEHTIKIDGDISTMNGTTPITIKDHLIVQGDVTALKLYGAIITANRIGTTTVRYAGNVVKNLTGNSEQIADCLAGEVLLNCGFEAYDASEGDGYSLTHPYTLAGRVYMGDAEDVGYGGECTVGFWNFQAGNPANIRTYAVCFDPSS